MCSHDAISNSATPENVNVIFLGNGIMIPVEQPNVLMLEMSP